MLETPQPRLLTKAGYGAPPRLSGANVKGLKGSAGPGVELLVGDGVALPRCWRGKVLWVPWVPAVGMGGGDGAD